MASQQSTVNYIVDQMRAAGAVSSRKMFGEYGIFCDGKMAALVCDDQLFVKPTAAGRAFIGEENLEEAPPYQGAKNCFLISEEQWEDPVWLSDLVKMTARELPLPKKKKSAS